MRVVGTDILDAFCQAHPDCRKWIALWLDDARAATWRSSHDIKARYASASFLASNFVIFNVRGNVYRLEVQVAYGVGMVGVKWIGTHADYSKRRK